MSMPHAPPPSSPEVSPIGYFFEPAADLAGETNFMTGVALVVAILLSIAHARNTSEVIPPFLLVFTSFIMLLVLHLLNKGQEIKLLTNLSTKRNYLGRLAYRLGTSSVILFTGAFALFIYPQNWVTMITASGLLGLAIWNITSPNRNEPFTGTNNLTNYWKRISGKAKFSQLDYGIRDIVRFSYEDGLMKDHQKQYHVFMNHILEKRFESDFGPFLWERQTLWSMHQPASQGQLSKGLEFNLANLPKKIIKPSNYQLIYWEVILQEVDGPFLERFLLGVNQYGKEKSKRLEALR